MSRRPTIPLPTIEKVTEIAEAAGFQCDKKELIEYTELIESTLGDYTRMYDLPEPKLRVKYFRDLSSIHKAIQEDNVHNAWALKMSIRGPESGKLSGKKVAIKDNMQIAGVPMTCGSELIRGFVPTEDAYIVTKILAAGGHIIGTTNVEDMCVSAASFSGINGSVLNPYDKTRTSGGSSSGSGVVVSTGEADLALGCDQGGSIRIPASCCGIVGLKPTYGLVSYTGIVPAEATVDHVGPMANTVADCALLLEVIAGYDGGLDSRQHRDVTSQEYTKLMTKSLSGRKIAYVKEGFDCCEKEVCNVVLESFKYFDGLTIDEVSIPWHTDGRIVRRPTRLEGMTEVMYNNRGVLYGMKGYKNTQLIDHLHNTMKTRFNYVSKDSKFAYLCGSYIKEVCGPGYYARACNLVRSLTAAYDDMLQKYDVLLMPTIPCIVPKLPQKQLGPKDAVAFASRMSRNTGSFNFTGHPAISINAGFSKKENLPVGLMIIGKHFDDATVLAYAHHFEKNRNTKE